MAGLLTECTLTTPVHPIASHLQNKNKTRQQKKNPHSPVAFFYKNHRNFSKQKTFWTQLKVKSYTKARKPN